MTSEKAADVLRPFGVDVRGVGSPCMASDSGFGRPGIARGKGRGCSGGEAGRGARGMRRCLVPSALTAALAVVLLSQWAAAQEAPAVASARETERPAEAGAGQEPAPGLSEQDSAPPAAADATELEQITVTGTRIRGGTTPSPVITIGSEAFREEGFSDLGEVIRSVPQNFSGGQNPGVAVGATSGAGGVANQNITGGSSLNLRGLGPDATLTLLNGRRLSYGGFAQAVDISAVPVEAVDRVEIMPDGASAIYGSDAVGGVGNVILRKGYEGLSVGARYGAATGGGLATREYTATAGAVWSGGGLIATHKDVSTDPIYSHQRNYTSSMAEPNTLYPGSDLRSALVSLDQAMGQAVTFRLDALRTRRAQKFYPWNLGQDPFFYRVTPETTTSFVSPGVDIALGGDWSLSLGGGWGRDRHVHDQAMVDRVTSMPTTVILDCYCNVARSYELGAEGPLFGLPGGDARMAIGVGVRRNEFVQSDFLAGADVIRGEERSRSAYAELSLPLVGAHTGIAGVRRLDVTVAVRGEDYDSFGRVTTPKLGVVYGPGEAFTLKASWGRSFKAPTLLQRYQSQVAMLYPASAFGGTGERPEATVLSLFGGNRDLVAERAATRTVSLAFHPGAMPGLEAELTVFDIDYTDRVVQPITDYGRALVNLDYAGFFDYAPSADALAAVIAGAADFYNLTGGTYDPDEVAAIMYAQYVNVARQRIKGLDLAGSYRFDLGPGRLMLRGAGSWLDSTQQNAATQDPYDIAGTLFSPARVHARLGAVWSQGGLSASTFANYTGGVADQGNDRKTASFTTFDATLRYATQAREGASSGLEVALSAQNLFDRAPPLHVSSSPDSPPYDSTNYSAIGRFLSVSVSKQW